MTPAATAPTPWTPADREFHRFSVDDYSRMIDEGVFHPDDRCELLEGLVVLKWPPWGHTTWIGDQYRWSVDQYHRMADLGILTRKHRVTLLEGLLVRKMTMHPPHAHAQEKCYKRLLFLLAVLGWTVRGEKPITLGGSEPEPDVSVARGSDDDYAARHPRPADLGLLVEVADSSLRDDRVDSARFYAEAGIPVYWIVNLIDRQIEVLTRPSGPCAAPAYAHQQVFLPGQAVPVILDGVTVGHLAVDDLLP